MVEAQAFNQLPVHPIVSKVARTLVWPEILRRRAKEDALADAQGDLASDEDSEALETLRHSQRQPWEDYKSI